MGSQVYASALIRISISEIQHRGAAYTRVGHLGTGIARGNAKLDIILQKTANSNNMIKYVPHLTGKLLPVTLNT